MRKPIRILLVEDSEDDAELVLFELSSGGYDTTCTRVDTLEAMSAALNAEPWDAVISDFSLPRFSGLAALDFVRKRDAFLPVIIVSGNIGEDIAVEAMRAGANDYVMKSNLSRLVPAITREVRDAAGLRAGRIAELELQENEERLRALVSNVPGVVFQLVRDPAGRYAFPYVSDGSLSLLELTPRQLREDYSRFCKLVLDEDRARLGPELDGSARHMKAVNWEGRIRAARTRVEKWVNLRMSPRPLGPGGVQWEGVMLNISNQKQAEVENLASRRRLSELSSHLQQAKDDERTRIAREVHDDIGGNLTAIKIDLLWMIKRLGKGSASLLEKARSCDALVDRTMEITSRIAQDLRPPLLELGLLEAIEWEAGEFQKRVEIPCEVQCASEDIAIDPELGNALFSIFRETLTNISKHAQATAVRVDLGVAGGTVKLSVQDNGRGIENTDLLKPASFGLRGMLERARNLGGEVSFEGAAGRGTTITVRLPLDRPQTPAPGAHLDNAGAS